MSLYNGLYAGTDQRFRHLLGKRVQFIYNGTKHAGVLEFAGINHLVHHKFQVTVSRTPYWPVDPNTIREYEG